MCGRHYQRKMRYGDPLAGGERYSSPEEAFLARTEPLVWSDCIAWTGASDHRGYGQISVGGKSVLAHRYAHEREHGPIPRDMVVDHACHHPWCVNPDHLRLATSAQNQANRAARERDLPRGVVRDGGRWRAEVGGDHIGSFASPEAAAIAAREERSRRYGEFAGKG